MWQSLDIVSCNQLQLTVARPVKEKAMKVEEGTDTDDTDQYHYQVSNELTTYKYHRKHEKLPSLRVQFENSLDPEDSPTSGSCSLSINACLFFYPVFYCFGANNASKL